MNHKSTEFRIVKNRTEVTFLNGFQRESWLFFNIIWCRWAELNGRIFYSLFTLINQSTTNFKLPTINYLSPSTLAPPASFTSKGWLLESGLPNSTPILSTSVAHKVSECQLEDMIRRFNALSVNADTLIWNKWFHRRQQGCVSTISFIIHLCSTSPFYPVCRK